MDVVGGGVLESGEQASRPEEGEQRWEDVLSMRLRKREVASSFLGIWIKYGASRVP